MAKFTFKKNPGGSWDNDTHYIKYKKKKCGSITKGRYDKNWTIGFIIKKDKPDENPNCDWKWIILKKKFEKPNEAKTFLNDNKEGIFSTYNIHFFED